jgi:tripeptidyl-peptidase-2
MADYAINQEWNCLSSQTCLNYSFKIPSATLCSVVCPSGSHGSHVAGIAAAYHPDEPEKNGIAPGAQILSIKIGDSRLDTLETHEGLLRAIRAVVKAGAHVANYSYGEPVRYPLKGSIFREIKEAYLKEGVRFVIN